MPKLELINGGLSPEYQEENERIFENFRRDFKSTLISRGIFNDFSLRKVFEEAINGQTDFSGHDKDIYDQIIDLLDNHELSPTPNEAALPKPKRIISKVA